MQKSRLWPVIGILAATGFWLVSAGANLNAGLSLSHDDFVSRVLGGASVSADLMKVAALLAAFAAFQNRRWVIFLVGMALFVMCSMWSYRAGVVFIADVLSERAAQANKAQTMSNKVTDLISLKERRAGFLAQQNFTPTSVKSRAAREAVVDENKRISREFSALTDDLADDIKKLKDLPPVKPDSLARMLQEFEIIPPGEKGESRLWLVTALFFALLLELGSGLGFLTITRAQQPRLPRLRAEPPPPAALPQPTLEATPQKPQIAPEVPAPALEVNTSAKPERPPQPAPEPAREVSREASNVVLLDGRPLPEASHTRLEGVLAMLLDHEAGGRVLLSEVVAMANANLPRHRRLTSTHKVTQLLPSALQEAGIKAQKAKVGGKVYLLGVVFKPAVRTRRA